jgi:glycine betaine/proline transport system substrate-binding protein
LDSAIYGIEPGAAANRLVLGMIKTDTFGLGRFRLIESSEQGMLAEVERAYRNRKPLVFVGWEPHPMNLRFKIQYLAGGDAAFGPGVGESLSTSFSVIRQIWRKSTISSMDRKTVPL